MEYERNGEKERSVEERGNEGENEEEYEGGETREKINT